MGEQNKEIKKKHYKSSIFFMAVLLIVGITLIIALVYSFITHPETLTGFLDEIKEILSSGGLFVSLFLVWILLIPILLLILFIVNLSRRKKLRKIHLVWEDAVRKAAKLEAAEEAKKKAKKEEIPPSRFGILNQLDNRIGVTVTSSDKRIHSLPEFCEAFRYFAASKLGLYYGIREIREFVASLAVSHIIILQGMSGTGKTSLAYAFGEFISNPSAIIPVQPMWKERTDLLGYYNEFTKRFNETILLQKMYEANKSSKMYIVVLDELNIARVEYYFAEFLSLMEIPNPESRYLDVVPDSWKGDPQLLKDGRIKLPENMWFIGTANNDDSTFAISDKVYDRAMVLNLNKKSKKFDLSESASAQTKISITAQEFQLLIEREQVGYEMTCRNERRLSILDEYMIEKFQITFGNRIMKQIRNYISVFVSCGGDELEALDDILCKKVMRKLASQNAAYVRSEAENLIQFLDELFGAGRMSCCREYISYISKNG